MLNQRGGESVPQVVSLAQICLDAHCRTVEGFCALLEKEWMAFGTHGLNLSSLEVSDCNSYCLFMFF